VPTIILRPGEALPKDIVLRDVDSGLTLTVTVIYLDTLEAIPTDIKLTVPGVQPAAISSHSLTTTGISSGVPSVDSPALTQRHNFGVSVNDFPSPTVGTPALTQIHALTATSIATAAPSVGAPALTQLHALSAISIATSAPSVGTPTLGQLHVLSATSIAAGTPSVGTPTLTEGAPLVLFGTIVSEPFSGPVLDTGWTVLCPVAQLGDISIRTVVVEPMIVPAILIGQVWIEPVVTLSSSSRPAILGIEAEIRQTPAKGVIR
jgi:hypothetical protein